MTQIISISNQKGGVAKTTSCISIGACLAEAGQNVLLLDFDPQVNLTITVGIDPENLDNTLFDLLNPGVDKLLASEVIQSTIIPGLDLLPADQRLIECELKSQEIAGYEQRLAEILDPLKKNYDYILIDCPPSMGSLTIMALTASNLALIPVQCDYYATRGLMSLLDLIEAVRQRTNSSLRYALFVTMFDARPLISRRILEQLQNNFPGELLTTTIGLDTRVRESAMANEPVITYAAKTRASIQYRSLAEELINRFDK